MRNLVNLQNNDRELRFRVVQDIYFEGGIENELIGYTFREKIEKDVSLVLQF